MENGHSYLISGASNGGDTDVRGFEVPDGFLRPRNSNSLEPIPANFFKGMLKRKVEAISKSVKELLIEGNGNFGPSIERSIMKTSWFYFLQAYLDLSSED